MNAQQPKRRLTVSEMVQSAPVRYFKRRGRITARCRYCGTLVRGGMRGMMKHANDCAVWSESARLATDTPNEVVEEIKRLNRELTKCRRRLRNKR